MHLFPAGAEALNRYPASSTNHRERSSSQHHSPEAATGVTFAFRSESRSHLYAVSDLEKIACVAETSAIYADRKRATRVLYDTRKSHMLTWIEDAQVASLRARCILINKTLMLLMQSIHERETPLTIVSTGSGNLLTEHLLHEKLDAAGFTHVAWRCIDPLYDDDSRSHAMGRARPSEANTRHAFAAGKQDVRYFGSEVQYLRHGQGTADRARGPVLLLSVAPPIALNDLREHFPDGTAIEGNISRDASHANKAYFLAIEPDLREHTEFREEFLESVERGIVRPYPNGMMFTGELNGACGIAEMQPADDESASFNQPREWFNHNIRMHQDLEPTTYEVSLATVARSFVKTYNDRNHVDGDYDDTLKVVLMNHYDTGLRNLKTFVAGGEHGGMFAELRRNEVVASHLTPA